MKTRLPLYLVDFGMQFKYKGDIYTLADVTPTGMYEALNKFGLYTEFKPNTAVYV